MITSELPELAFMEKIMKKSLVLILTLASTMSACTSLHELKNAERAQYFVLERDHVRTETRGLAGFRWVEGLKAGKYTAVAQDAEGIYFAGEGSSVIALRDEEGDEYKKTGNIPEAALQINRYPRAANVGGLWVPKPSSRQETRLFFSVKVTPGKDLLQGLIGHAMAQAADGSLSHIPYGSEKAFVQSLKIVDDQP